MTKDRPRPAMFDAAVFDLGNVLVGWDPATAGKTPAGRGCGPRRGGPFETGVPATPGRLRSRLPAAPVIGELEQVLVSGEVGLVKPDPAIFILALDRFGLDPMRTVFVDDQPANTDTAARLGFSTVTLTDSPTLRAELTRLGVLPAD